MRLIENLINTLEISPVRLVRVENYFEKYLLPLTIPARRFFVAVKY